MGVVASDLSNSVKELLYQALEFLKDFKGDDKAVLSARGAIDHNYLFFVLASMEFRWDDFPKEVCESLKEYLKRNIPKMSIKVRIRSFVCLIDICLLLLIYSFFFWFVGTRCFNVFLDSHVV
jgi:hypothetical protein